MARWQILTGIMIATAMSNTADGATISKLSKNKNQLFARLSQDELGIFAPGVKVLIEVPVLNLTIAGEVIKLDNEDAQLWLDGSYPTLKTKMELKLAIRQDGVSGAANSKGAKSGLPRSALVITKYYLSPLQTMQSDPTPTSSDLVQEPFVLGQYMRLSWYYVNGQIQVGPDFAYFSQKSKAKTVVTTDDSAAGDSIEEESDVTLTSYEVGATLRYHLWPFNTQAMDPFGYAGAGLGQTAVAVGDADPATGKRQFVRVGFGLSYFMTNNLAGDLALEYRQDSINIVTTEVTTTSASTTATEVDQTITLSTTSFVYGLSIFF